MSDIAREAKEIIERFSASPRFAGSDAENLFRAECENRLNRMGFSTRREAFAYSQFPAKAGPFVCGIVFAAGMYLAGHLASSHRSPGLAIVIAIAGVVVTWALGRMLLYRTLTLPMMRTKSENLIATRGDGEPKVWLIAHTDTKSQTIRMLIRVASVATTWVLFVIAVGSMVAQMSGFSAAMGYPEELIAAGSGIASVLCAIAILPVALCFIGNESPGALDNASGVAAVLLALDQIPRERSVGVVFTSAEELALAGAMAFVGSRASRGIAINCDTIDDQGGFICMTDNKGSRAAQALARGAGTLGEKVRIRGMISGILTDSIPLSRAGWDAVTLSRGNLGTLSRVHTSGDAPGRIGGAGIAMAARIIAATVEELA